MKNKKLKLLTIFMLLLPLCVVILGAGCEKEKDFDTKSQLLGEWVEQEPFSDGVCDTIIFKEDNTIDLYNPIEGWTYSLPSSDTIAFTDPTRPRTQKCHFMFTNENKLTLFNFWDRTITSQIKDITFKKIN